MKSYNVAYIHFRISFYDVLKQWRTNTQPVNSPKVSLEQCCSRETTRATNVTQYIILNFLLATLEKLKRNR